MLKRTCIFAALFLLASCQENLDKTYGEWKLAAYYGNPPVDLKDKCPSIKVAKNEANDVINCGDLGNIPTVVVTASLDNVTKVMPIILLGKSDPRPTGLNQCEEKPVHSHRAPAAMRFINENAFASLIYVKSELKVVYLFVKTMPTLQELEDLEKQIPDKEDKQRTLPCAATPY